MNLSLTVGQMVVERPSRARVFEQLGINYCCGGKVSLEETCAKKGLDFQKIRQELEREASQSAPQGTDWSSASLAQLADHVEQTHHAYLKRELPRLDAITEKVARVHGRRHAELVPLRETFSAFKTEMDQHIAQEEQVLFPICRELDNPAASPSSPNGSVRNPIAAMIREHEHAGDALEKMRQLTAGFLPPPDACNTYRVMLSSLAELEQDLHIHVHKENNILFPKAIAAEQHAGS